MAQFKPNLTDKMAEEIAEHLSKFSRGLTRSEITSSLGLGSSGDTTIWRWLTNAKAKGLIEMVGNTSQARWVASEELRRVASHEFISRPLGKRPASTYNELWLKDYVPNQTKYLSTKDLALLHNRSPVGSAPISKFDKHDLSKFLCGLPFGSSALEGNSYDMLDTVRLIEHGMHKEGASPTETRMILNHHEAVRYLLEHTNHPPAKEHVQVNTREVKALHSLLSRDLLADPSMSGRIRNTRVSIKDCAYTPLDIREALEGCLSHVVDTAVRIEDPYEQSFFLVVHMSYLQPFVDCNKRTARVACNIPLLRNGVAPMSWIGVDNQAMRDALLGVYELNDTSMLTEVFVDGYMRSIESFNIMKQSREPDEVSIKYHREVRQAVRQQVLEGDDSIPASVDKEDHHLFVLNVEKELNALRIEDHGALIRNQLREGDVMLWMAPKKAQQERER